MPSLGIALIQRCPCDYCCVRFWRPRGLRALGQERRVFGSRPNMNSRVKPTDLPKGGILTRGYPVAVWGPGQRENFFDELKRPTVFC